VTITPFSNSMVSVVTTILMGNYLQGVTRICDRPIGDHMFGELSDISTTYVYTLNGLILYNS